MEEIFIRAENGCLISCQPCFKSIIRHRSDVPGELANLEGRYFAVWKYYKDYRYVRDGTEYQIDDYGCGFASSSLIQSLKCKPHDRNGATDTEIEWSLQQNFHHQALHYFMTGKDLDDKDLWRNHKNDPLHIIGHQGWYQQLYKPLLNVWGSPKIHDHLPLQLAKRYWLANKS
jgi:hypothetical protein